MQYLHVNLLVHAQKKNKVVAWLQKLSTLCANDQKHFGISLPCHLQKSNE